MERRERLAYLISEAMRRRGLSAPTLATQLGKASLTVRRWRNGETVPSIIDAGPLGEALGVAPELLLNPPEIPRYALDEYLVRDAVDSAVDEAVARDRQRRGRGDD